MISWPYTLFPLVFLISLLCHYTYAIFWKYGHWRRRGILSVPPSYPFGNLKRSALLEENVGFTLRDIYCGGAGQPIVGYFVLFRPSLLIRDPSLARAILTTRFDHFSERSHELPSEDVDPLVSRSLFGLPLQEWRRLRRCLAPSFGGAVKLRSMFSLALRCTDQLSRTLEETVSAGDGVLDVKDVMKRFQTDLICLTMLGTAGDALSNEDSYAYRIAEEILESSLKRALTTLTILLFAPVSKLLKLKFSPERTVMFFRDVLQKKLRSRTMVTSSSGCDVDENPSGEMGAAKGGGDFLEDLLRMREGSSDKTSAISLTDDDLVAQLAFFYLAGFETTSSTLAFCLHELSKHQSIQKRLAEELDETLAGGGGSLEYGCLGKMTYADKVIHETLRKYPILPILCRRCVKDYKIPGTDWTIEKGTDVSISVLGLHWDHNYFPHPMKFDPNRFEEKEVSKRPPGSYMPYSLGPKACLGSQFASMTMKAVIAGIFRKYEVHPWESTPDVLPIDAYVFPFSPKGPIKLKFVRRKP